MTLAKKPVVTIAPTTSVKDAAGLMVKRGVRRLPVMQSGTRKPIGMLRSRDLVNFLGGGVKHDIIRVKFRGNFYSAMNERVRSIMLSDFPRGNVYMSLADAARILLQTGVGGIPVLDGEGRLEGMISERDFIAFAPATMGAPVSYYMVRHVVTGEPELSIKEAAHRMISWGVRRLPVVRGRELVGIVTTVDVLRYFGTGRVFKYMRSGQMEEVLSVPVQEIMTEDVVKVTPETDVGEAAALMREKGCGGLPVVSENALVGIITERDFLRLLV
jgi:CBS domain-containing protein